MVTSLNSMVEPKLPFVVDLKTDAHALDFFNLDETTCSATVTKRHRSKSKVQTNCMVYTSIEPTTIFTTKVKFHETKTTASSHEKYFLSPRPKQKAHDKRRTSSQPHQRSFNESAVEILRHDKISEQSRRQQRRFSNESHSTSTRSLTSHGTESCSESNVSVADATQPHASQAGAANSFVQLSFSRETEPSCSPIFASKKHVISTEGTIKAHENDREGIACPRSTLDNCSGADSDDVYLFKRLDKSLSSPGDQLYNAKTSHESQKAVDGHRFRALRRHKRRIEGQRLLSKPIKMKQVKFDLEPSQVMDLPPIPACDAARIWYTPEELRSFQQSVQTIRGLVSMGGDTSGLEVRGIRSDEATNSSVAWVVAHQSSAPEKLSKVYKTLCKKSRHAARLLGKSDAKEAELVWKEME